MESSTIYLAAGCFWGVELGLQRLEGVLDTEVGYCGGHGTDPDYKQVCTGKTGHAETVRVVFDPERLSLERLLEYFFASHDPTSVDRQGPDIGSQYRSAIFYVDVGQLAAAQRVRDAHPDHARIVTELSAYQHFYPAEAYHQDYLRKRGR